MTEVTDLKRIAVNYLSFWFLVDFISIVPFGRIANGIAGIASSSNGGKANMMIRVSKLGKIYKLIKLARLVKIMKLIKNKDSLNHHLQK